MFLSALCWFAFPTGTCKDAFVQESPGRNSFPALLNHQRISVICIIFDMYVYIYIYIYICICICIMYMFLYTVYTCFSIMALDESHISLLNRSLISAWPWKVLPW